MIQCRELLPQDGAAVARLEARFHDASLADPAENHIRWLQEAEDAGTNLSFGLFEGEELVGYLLCYGFEPSLFPEEGGEAIYIEDVTVDESHRTGLARLLKSFLRATALYFPEAALEAHAVTSVRDTWHRHEGMWQRMGYREHRTRATDEILNGETRHVIRWNPMERGKDRTARILDRLPAHEVSVDGTSWTVKLVQKEEDWAALEPVWDPLLLATPEHTVFQSYRYQRMWWRHFGDESELFIGVVVREGEVVGIAPMRLHDVRRHGRDLRELTFIGSRWEVDRPQFLVSSEPERLTRVFARFLASQQSRWDIADLYEQRSRSPVTTALIEELRAAGLLVGTVRDSDCAYLAFQGTYQEFLAGKSQKFRKNLKASARRLAEIGPVECRVHESLPAVSERLEHYRQLERRSWKDAEGAGVARSDTYFAFYQDMAETFGRDGSFVIRELSAGDRPVAATFGLSFDGVYYSLQITHDRELDRCSPGTYLESLEFEECFRRGYREYEFLGGFLSNKLRWTSTFRFTTQVHVYRRTPRLSLMFLLHFVIKPRVKELIRPFMKSWPKKLPAEDEPVA